MRPYRVLLLTSYCGTDNKKCSDEYPCDECLKMCNVMTTDEKFPLDMMTNIGGFEFNKTKDQKK